MAKQMSRIKSKQSVLQYKTSQLFFRLLITTLLVLTAIISLVQAATCPSSVPSSATNTTERYKFSGSSPSTFGIVGGPVSNSLYYWYDLGSYYNAAVRKVDAAGSQIWVASFVFDPIHKSLSVDASEQSVYLTFWNTLMTVLKLSTTNGSIVSQHQFTGVDGRNHDIKIWPLDDLSGYFVIGYDNPTNFAKICKYTFSSSSAMCQKITNINTGYGHLMVSNSQFFVLGTATVTPNNLNMFKITFSLTAVNWANQITCSGTCYAFLSESLLSSDKSTIYSFFLFGLSADPYNLYFAGLSVTDGSVTTTRYKLSGTVSNLWGSAMNGDYVVATTQYQKYLIIYSISSSAFTIYSFSGYSLYGCTVEPSSGRFVAGGRTSGTDGYITKFVPQSITLNSDFSLASCTMAVLASGQDDIISQNGVSIAVTDTSFNPTAGSYTNQSATYNSISNTTSDVYFQVKTQTISVCELTTSTQTPNLPCSFSGATSIVFKLSSYNGGVVPSFVSIDSTTGALSITAPSFSNSTDYSFNILSTVSGMTDPAQTIIKLNVKKNTAEDCGFIASETAKSLGSSIQGATAATALFSVGISFTNLSLLAILWSALNQMQILFFLFLTRAFIPKDIEVVITGLTICINPFSYLQFQFGGDYNFVSSYFNFGLDNSSLKKFGIQSDSTIVNMNSFILSILIFCFLHLCIVLTQKLLSKESKSNCCSYVLSGIHMILQKVMIFFTFALYIRAILQTNQFTLISCVSELYNFNVSNTKRIMSIIIAFFVLIACIAIIVITILLTLSKDAYKLSESPDKRSKLDHLFNGVSLNKKSRMFICFLLIRRLIFIILLITVGPKSSIVAISLLVVFQLIYFGLLIAIRPYKEVNCNIIEIINEMYFLLIIASLLKFNTAASWEGIPTTVYTWFISSNSFVGLFVNLVDGVRKIVIKCKNKYCKKREEPIQIMNIMPIVASRIDNSANDADQSNVRVNNETPDVNVQFRSGVTRHRVGNRVYVKR